MCKKRFILPAILLLILCVLVAYIHLSSKNNEDIVIIDGVCCGMSMRTVSSLLGTPISKEIDSMTGGVIAKYHYALNSDDSTGDVTCRFVKTGMRYKLYAVSVSFTLNKESQPSVFMERLTDSLMDRYQNNKGYSFQERDGTIVIMVSEGAELARWELKLSDGKVIARWEAVF